LIPGWAIERYKLPGPERALSWYSLMAEPAAGTYGRRFNLMARPAGHQAGTSCGPSRPTRWPGPDQILGVLFFEKFTASPISFSCAERWFCLCNGLFRDFCIFDGGRRNAARREASQDTLERSRDGKNGKALRSRLGLRAAAGESRTRRNLADNPSPLLPCHPSRRYPLPCETPSARSRPVMSQ
jgi:hypothetical protein